MTDPLLRQGASGNTGTNANAGGNNQQRRPSYTAEFSSRPRLLDEDAMFGGGPSGANPNVWGSRIWNPGSISGEANLPNAVLDDIPASQKKSFRSLSFSHTGFKGPAHQAGSHMLDTFNEEEGGDEEHAEEDENAERELVDRLSGTKLAEANKTRSSNNNNGQQGGYTSSLFSGLPGTIGQSSSLWFGPGSRRHSYAAGEHLARVNTSPSSSKLDLIDDYFSVDELGRNVLPEYIPSPGGSLHSPTSPPNTISPPPESIISVPSKKLYYVEFKAGRIDVFFIADNSSLVAKIGDLVIVDADRGRDLGKVVKDHVSPHEAGVLKLRRHQEQQAILQHNPNTTGAGGNNPGNTNTPGVTMPKQILRYAQPNEVQQILAKQQDEEKAVQMCVQKVQEKGLDMSVLDAEYQWDRRKLTFFYSATHRIDFRDLVRDLFRIYKTRIWMCAVNVKASNSTTATNTTHHSQQQQQHQAEYGLASSQLFNATRPPVMPPPATTTNLNQSQHSPPQQHPRYQSQLFSSDLWGQPQPMNPNQPPPPPPPPQGQFPMMPPPPPPQQQQQRGNQYWYY
jgi:cell fate regulator YaaT (PSP1 superfamily)